MQNNKYKDGKVATDKKWPTILIIIVLAISLFTSLVLLYREMNGAAVPANNLPSQNASSTASEKNAVEIKYSEYDLYSNSTFAIKINYPQIKNVSVGSVAERINAEIAKNAKTSFESIISDFEETIRAEKETSENGQTSGNDLSEVGTVDEAYLSFDKNIFSFSLSKVGYSGGAHGYNVSETSNYDLLTGSKIGLSELLIGGYVPAIKKYITEQIQKNSSNCTGCDRIERTEELSSEIAENALENFYLSDSGITFIFNEYELGAYASTAGGQLVFVPKGVLVSYIKRDW